MIRRRHHDDLVDFDPRLQSGSIGLRGHRRSYHDLDDFGGGGVGLGLGLGLGGRQMSPRRSFHHRHSLEDLTIGGGGGISSSLGGQHREETLSTLQRHLAELKKDNRQMSVRLVRAEDCLQTLENDEDIFPQNYSEEFEDFDAAIPDNWTEEDKKRRRLRRELREIRADLDSMRNTLRRDDDPSSVHLQYNEYNDGRMGQLSPRRQRRSQWNMQREDYGGEENDGGLTEWGARQLGGGSWRTNSPSRQCTDLDYYGRPMLSNSGNMHRSRSATTHAAGVGYRSVFPRPLVTQHSRMHSATSPRRRFDVDGGDYAFVPSSPADLSIGDRVKVSRSRGGVAVGSGASHAFVKYVGHLPGKVGPYVGLELENEGGKHDGLHNGYRYFQCRGNRGIFVPFDRIMLAWRQ